MDISLKQQILISSACQLLELKKPEHHTSAQPQPHVEWSIIQIKPYSDILRQVREAFRRDYEHSFTFVLEYLNLNNT